MTDQWSQMAMLSRLSPIGLSFGLAAHVALAQGTTAPPTEPSFTTGLWTRSTLLGDAGGLRSMPWNYGITFGIQDINEVWGNVTGGIQRGASYDGVTLMSIGLDTQRAFGWEGGNPPGGPFDDDSQLRGSTRWGGNFNLRPPVSRKSPALRRRARYTPDSPAPN
jgi:carbohydrate-selective porin OprB